MIFRSYSRRIAAFIIDWLICPDFSNRLRNSDILHENAAVVTRNRRVDVAAANRVQIMLNRSRYSKSLYPTTSIKSGDVDDRLHRSARFSNF